MDHLIATDDVAGPSDEVHFMVTDSSQYDGTRMTAFSCRLSFISREIIAQNAQRVDTLELKKPPGSPVQEIAFLRSWLFFGVLESFAPLRTSCSFVSVRNDRQLLTLPFPAKYISKLKFLGRGRDADRHRANFGELLDLAESLAHESLGRGTLRIRRS